MHKTSLMINHMFWIVVVVFAQVTIGCTQNPAQQTQGTSAPNAITGTRFVTDGPNELITVQVASTMSIGIRVCMTGGDSDLDQIDDDEMSSVVMLVRKMIRDYGFALKDENENLSARTTLRMAINESLGRVAVNDVHFSGFIIGDYQPVLE